MENLPTLDFSKWEASPAQRQAFLRNLRQACTETGFFYLKNHGIAASLCGAVLTEAERFFALPAPEKAALHIRHSSNFRGFSEMKNSRDWREQVHFGPELPGFRHSPDWPDYCRLLGENLWPAGLGSSYRDTMLEFLHESGKLGARLLAAVAESLDLAPDTFAPLSGQTPYLLMKTILYYAQPDGGAERSGVAPHCDWSWLTILLQDSVGGLEILSKNGAWHPVRPKEGLLSVNLGELLELVSGGVLRAAPHRVLNPSRAKKRLSVPVFVNPPLRFLVAPKMPPSPKIVEALPHVHRVEAAGKFPPPFIFGESEWRRKGLGKWCHDDSCLKK